MYRSLISGRFLWVAFQLESICSQETDEGIYKALRQLPKDLPETYDRILEKLSSSKTSDPILCKKIFDLVAAALRPLTLEELREAISVEPGDTIWDLKKLANNMLKVIGCCGSLLVIDEETSTVRFTHHSVKQYLVSDKVSSAARTYRVTSEEADLSLGQICVTYLNFNVFDQQMTKVPQTTKVGQSGPSTAGLPATILSRSLHQSLISKIALNLLKAKAGSGGKSSPTLINVMEKTEQPNQHTQESYHFLAYAQEYWLLHSKTFGPDHVASYPLWLRLIGGQARIAKLSWGTDDWFEVSSEYLNWTWHNDHGPLLQRAFTRLRKQTAFTFDKDEDKMDSVLDSVLAMGPTSKIQPQYYALAAHIAARRNNIAVLKILTEKHVSIDNTRPDLGSPLYVASIKGREETIRFLLDLGVDVNAQGGEYGNALQAASWSGNEAIIKLLLKRGADINAQGGNYGNALQAASVCHNNATIQLLLEHGADVNAQGGEYGTALQAACTRDTDNATIQLLLEYGADVNAQEYGTALQAASRRGNKAIIQLLLEHGADVNAQGGEYGTALQDACASWTNGKDIVELLLEYGADVDTQGGKYGSALRAAEARDRMDVVELLLRHGALK